MLLLGPKILTRGSTDMFDAFLMHFLVIGHITPVVVVALLLMWLDDSLLLSWSYKKACKTCFY